MKIVHIAGWSGSGKTTFIQNLCEDLTRLGKTGTVKHIGGHHCIMPAGKDTTLHFMAGADPAVGIDSDKCQAFFHSVDLDSALTMMSDSGVRFAVIEGYKTRPFRKVIIGDLDGDCLLKNPEVSDVISHLDQFDDWYTPAGITREVEEEVPDAQVLTWTTYAYDYHAAVAACRNIEDELTFQDDNSVIRAKVQRWGLNERYPVYVVIALRHAASAGDLLSQIMVRLHPYGPGQAPVD